MVDFLQWLIPNYQGDIYDTSSPTSNHQIIKNKIYSPIFLKDKQKKLNPPRTHNFSSLCLLIIHFSLCNQGKEETQCWQLMKNCLKTWWYKFCYGCLWCHYCESSVSVNHGVLSLMAKTSSISTFSTTRPPLTRTGTPVSSLSNAKNLPMIVFSPSFNMNLLKYCQHKLFLHRILVFLSIYELT